MCREPGNLARRHPDRLIAPAPVLTRILERLNTEPGVEGMTGRYAGSAAKDFWSERPRAEREAAANRCRERFGGA